MLAGKGHFSLSKFSHVFRGDNKAADCLAAYGHTHSDSIFFNSLGSLPFDSSLFIAKACSFLELPSLF